VNNSILVINSGSSSIKFSLYTSGLNLIYHGDIDGVNNDPFISIIDKNHNQVLQQKIASSGHDAALRFFFVWLDKLSQEITLTAVGHRVVHGGKLFLKPTVINDDVITKLESLSPLAPLHQPHNLEAIKIIQTIQPGLLQIACFDTNFHQTQEPLATMFAIPKALTEDGVIRYGFHGISYEYIASVASQYLDNMGSKRIIAAHLGNGASMCAMLDYKSVSTSMGFTAIDGLMMGTRCGRIDPGVLLYLMNEKKYSSEDLEHLLYSESGLLGVSGVSNDVRTLLQSNDPDAMVAIDLFCYRAAQEIGSLCVSLDGIDGVVFTAGIGENSALIRQKICNRLKWLGVMIDDGLNQKNSSIISSNESRVVVAVIPTNEELMIAKHVKTIIN
jgi:acetate kinase